MKRLQFILVVAILSAGCSRNRGIDYSKPFDPDIVQLSDLTYREVPFKGQVSMLDQLGQPDTTWQQQQTFRYFASGDSLVVEEQMVEVRGYDHQVWLHVLSNGTYLVQEVYFRSPEATVKHPQVKFTSKTKVAEMRKVFPNSYTHLQRTADFETKRIESERLILGTTEENRDGSLRLLFVEFEDGRLVSFLLL